MEMNMESVIGQANEQRMVLQKLTTRRKELEKMVALKEKDLQDAKERNRTLEFRNETQAFRILQCEENHKLKAAELEHLRSQMEGSAMRLVQAQSKQKVRLAAHRALMKDLTQKFQTGPETYTNEPLMENQLSVLERKHESMQKKVASVQKELARKKATFNKLYRMDKIKPNTITVDGNMAAIVQQMSNQKKLELKQSEAKIIVLQKKFDNLLQINSLLQADLTRLEAKMSNVNVA